MIRLHLRAAIAALLAFVALSVAAGTAIAGAYTQGDGVADAKKESWSGAVTAPMLYQADLTRYQYWHSANSTVTFRWHFRDLRSDYRFPRIFMANQYGNSSNITIKNGGSTAVGVMGSSPYYTCEGKVAKNFTDNYATVTLPRWCFKKGAAWRPYVDVRYENTSGYKGTYDGHAYGPVFYPNP